MNECGSLKSRLFAAFSMALQKQQKKKKYKEELLCHKMTIQLVCSILRVLRMFDQLHSTGRSEIEYLKIQGWRLLLSLHT